MAQGYTIRSSLPLQILLYFNSWWTGLYFVVCLIEFIYKGIELPYPDRTIGWEIFFLFCWTVVDAARIFQGNKGNLTAQASPMLRFFLLCVFAMVGNMYFCWFQIYVLRLDRIMNIVSFAFGGAEMFLGIWVTITFAKTKGVS